MNKQIKAAVAIAVIIIVAGIVSGIIYINNTNNNQKEKDKNQTIIAPLINNSQQNKDTDKTDSVAVGKPCDFGNLKSIADTKGLQCYAYEDLSDRMLNNGLWVYPSGKQTVRKGIWVYPNHMSIPAFLAQAKPSLFDAISLNDLVRNWKTYNNPIGNYSFKFPNQWDVKTDTSNPNQLKIVSTYVREEKTQATITYYPNIEFETTNDYLNIKEAPDDWLTPDNSTDSFILIRHFDLNGATALLLERMGNRSGSPYDQTVFVTKPNSYFTIAYTKYNDVDSDLPVEMLIKTLQFK